MKNYSRYIYGTIIGLTISYLCRVALNKYAIIVLVLLIIILAIDLINWKSIRFYYTSLCRYNAKGRWSIYITPLIDLSKDNANKRSMLIISVYWIFWGFDVEITIKKLK